MSMSSGVAPLGLNLPKYIFYRTFIGFTYILYCASRQSLGFSHESGIDPRPDLTTKPTLFCTVRSTVTQDSISSSHFPGTSLQTHNGNQALACAVHTPSLIYFWMRFCWVQSFLYYYSLVASSSCSPLLGRNKPTHVVRYSAGTERTVPTRSHPQFFFPGTSQVIKAGPVL